MNKYVISCDFVYSVDGTIEFEANEEELEDCGSVDGLRNCDWFYDMVRDECSYPRCDNVRIEKFTVTAK